MSELLARARAELRPDQPETILPLLVKAYREMEALRDPWVGVKRKELLHAIELAAGLWLDAEAERWDVVPGSSLSVTLQALNRSRFPLVWDGVEVTGVARATVPAIGTLLVYNAPEKNKVSVSLPAQTPYSQPFWLREPRTGDSYTVDDPALIGCPDSPPALEAVFTLRAESGPKLLYRIPVHYRWVDRVSGEQVRPVEIVPPVSVTFALPSIIFPEAKARRVLLRVTAVAGAAKGSVSLDLPSGWKATPAAAAFELSDREQQASLPFEVTPPAVSAGGHATARAEVGGVTVSTGLVTIHYPHIPPPTLFAGARARLERFDARLTARNIGYVMGAGDEVPQALEQLGATVRLLSAEDLAAGDLSRFDAIVTGVRAVNVRPDLVAERQRLLEYVETGGTLVVQYNTLDGFGPVAATGRSAAQIAPYPLTPSNNRVSVEEAPVTFPNPDLPVLHRPNEITARDFEGWVQERGLYFMSRWDERYKPVFACNDPGEPPRLGGTLFARYGKGVFIYTGYSWFRELPAGVPGAYRIFANLVSAGK
ncbi:MAG: LmbE family protein [Acidobacteria bacterium]|nr:LmbE family protein [Acidobacteriota bacterium]